MTLDRYKVTLEEGELEGAKIDHFDVDAGSIAALSYAMHGRPVRSGTYTRLTVDGQLWMTDTNAEVSDHLEAIWAIEHEDTRRVLINGLGIGMTLKAALACDHVEHVDVVEIDERVVKLVGSQYDDPRVTFHVADAYEMQWPVGTRWDVAWHDIWADINGDNTVGMGKLKRKYGRRVSWQGAWCQAQCVKANRDYERQWGWLR